LTSITNNLDHNKDRGFEFDALGRLKKATGGIAAGATGVTANWSQEYGYDRYGNRSSVAASGVTADSDNVPSDGLPSLSHNTANNRISTTGWEYDLAGNLIRGQNESGVWQKFEYDAASRLVKIKDDSNNALETYTYGASRNRLINEYSSGRTYYCWGGGSPIIEYTESTLGTAPSYSKSYVYAGSRLLLTARNVSGSELLEFHHPDRLGTKLVTNPSASSSFQQSHLPFGTALNAESTGFSNQVFTSYDRSAATGLDYAINRIHSPGQGRFTQVDPIGVAAASALAPQSNNLYSYVQNMPTDFVDSSGLFMYIGPAYGWYDADFLRFLFDSWEHSQPPTTDDPGGTTGGGGGESENPESSNQQDDYSSCVRQQILQSIRRTTSGIAQMYLGGVLMAGSSALFALGLRWGFRHGMGQLAAGNFVNGIAGPDHGGRLSAIGVPGYYAGLTLFSNGLDITRLNRSATDMAIRHCRALFPN
jgi:RHS repeat-associated protein